MIAAQILLQNYLDSGCPETEAPATPLADEPEEETE
jgi:putative Holliday junction resolvase